MEEAEGAVFYLNPLCSKCDEIHIHNNIHRLYEIFSFFEHVTLLALVLIKEGLFFF